MEGLKTYRKQHIVTSVVAVIVVVFRWLFGADVRTRSHD